MKIILDRNQIKNTKGFHEEFMALKNEFSESW